MAAFVLLRRNGVSFSFRNQEYLHSLRMLKINGLSRACLCPHPLSRNGAWDFRGCRARDAACLISKQRQTRCDEHRKVGELLLLLRRLSTTSARAVGMTAFGPVGCTS